MLDPKDLRIETYSAATPHAETTMRITHIPSGLYIEGTKRSTFKLRQELLADLDHIVNRKEPTPFGLDSSME